MKKRKSVLTSLVLITLINSSANAQLDAAGVKMMKEAGKVWEKIAAFITSYTAENTEKAEKAFEKIDECVAEAGEAAQRASESFGLEAATKIAEAADHWVPIGWVIAGVYASTKVCGTLSDLKGYVRPAPKTIAEKRKEVEDEAQYNFLKAKKELLDSIKEHMFEERGYKGLPKTCEQHAINLGAADGKKELDRISKEFNGMIKEMKRAGLCPA